MSVEIVSTKCTEEEQEEDRPALEKAHKSAMKTEPSWEFFGGTITLSNGHEYQVIASKENT
tara:strand:- start:474 stop:656 length:183 start_codon:yes stop_codon:yes gene_type:complete